MALFKFSGYNPIHVLPFFPTEVKKMSKGMDSKKTAKKEPAKTMKEKKSAKKVKKAEKKGQGFRIS
jgi:hypothetical protein